MDSDEIERLIRANVDETVTVFDVDGEIQNLLVHSVDERDLSVTSQPEMTQPPACACWVRFTDVCEVHQSYRPSLVGQEAISRGRHESLRA